MGPSSFDEYYNIDPAAAAQAEKARKALEDATSSPTGFKNGSLPVGADLGKEAVAVVNRAPTLVAPAPGQAPTASSGAFAGSPEAGIGALPLGAAPNGVTPEMFNDLRKSEVAGGGYATNPAANTPSEYRGGHVAVNSIGQDQTNLNALLTAAVSGSGVLGVDGKTYSPAQVMQNLANQGNPLGTAWVNANTGFREDKLGAAGKTQAAAFDRSANALASGRMGRDAYASATSAANAVAGAGQSQLNLNSQGAAGALRAAAGMSGDIAGLRDAAAGRVPSAAAIQQKQGIGDAINAQAALAAGARGGDVGGAMRSAAGAGAGIATRGLADAAALRANEQANARAQLTQATASQANAFVQGAGVANAGAQTAITRADAAAGRQFNLGSAQLGSQVTGMTAQSQGYEREQARTLNQISIDQDEQRQLQNYMLQLFNTANGNAASIDNSQRAAAVQTRAQDFQLYGSMIGAGGASAASLFGG